MLNVSDFEERFTVEQCTYNVMLIHVNLTCFLQKNRAKKSCFLLPLFQVSEHQVKRSILKFFIGGIIPSKIPEERDMENFTPGFSKARKDLGEADGTFSNH